MACPPHRRHAIEREQKAHRFQPLAINSSGPLPPTLAKHHRKPDGMPHRQTPGLLDRRGFRLENDSAGRVRLLKNTEWERYDAARGTKRAGVRFHKDTFTTPAQSLNLAVKTDI